MIAEPNIACTILVNLSMVRSSRDSARSLFVYPYDRDRIVRRNGALFGEMPGISNANVSPCKSRVTNDEEGRNYVFRLGTSSLRDFYSETYVSIITKNSGTRNLARLVQPFFHRIPFRFYFHKMQHSFLRIVRAVTTAKFRLLQSTRKAEILPRL